MRGVVRCRARAERRVFGHDGQVPSSSRRCRRSGPRRNRCPWTCSRRDRAGRRLPYAGAACSSSEKLGIRCDGTSLRPLSMRTYGVLLYRCDTIVARMISWYSHSSSTTLASSVASDPPWRRRSCGYAARSVIFREQLASSCGRDKNVAKSGSNVPPKWVVESCIRKTASSHQSCEYRPIWLAAGIEEYLLVKPIISSNDRITGV